MTSGGDIIGDDGLTITTGGTTDIILDSDVQVTGTLSVALGATFETLIQLEPSDDPPTGAGLGYIYCDTDGHLYFYNGATWKQIDN
jgi:hypothetical protein